MLETRKEASVLGDLQCSIGGINHTYIEWRGAVRSPTWYIAKRREQRRIDFVESSYAYAILQSSAIEIVTGKSSPT